MKYSCSLNMDFELLISQDGPCFVYATLTERRNVITLNVAF